MSLLLLLLLLLQRTASGTSVPVDALLSPLILLEGPAADVGFVAALSTDASGAAVWGKTRVSVVTSAAGASAASASVVGPDCSGPSNRGISAYPQFPTGATLHILVFVILFPTSIHPVSSLLSPI